MIKELIKSAEHHKELSRTVVERVRSGQHAFIHRRTNLIYIMKNDYLQTNRCDFTIGEKKKNFNLQIILTHFLNYGVASYKRYNMNTVFFNLLKTKQIHILLFVKLYSAKRSTGNEDFAEEKLAMMLPKESPYLNKINKELSKMWTYTYAHRQLTSRPEGAQTHTITNGPYIYTFLLFFFFLLILILNPKNPK